MFLKIKEFRMDLSIMLSKEHLLKIISQFNIFNMNRNEQNFNIYDLFLNRMNKLILLQDKNNESLYILNLL